MRKSTLKKPAVRLQATEERLGEDSITDSTDVDSVPLRVRMLKKNTLKKPETASTCSDEATGK